MIVLLPIAGAVATVVGAYYLPIALRMYRTYSLRKFLARKGELILTYDDGPSPVLTPRLLDLLQKHGAKATFFLLGQNAQRFPAIVDRIVREGHDIGCHSNQHLNAWKVLPGAATKDVEDGYQVISRWADSDCVFRPPYGKMTLCTLWAIWRRGASVAWWTINSGDTLAILPNPRAVCDRVMRSKGGIVLMHDIDRSAARDDFVLETTNLLLQLSAKGHVKMGRLLHLCRQI